MDRAGLVGIRDPSPSPSAFIGAVQRLWVMLQVERQLSGRLRLPPDGGDEHAVVGRLLGEHGRERYGRSGAGWGKNAPFD